MTSLMTSQSDDKLGLLYSCLNEIGVFDNQKIEITYKNYSTLNTWATLMKQKMNYSQYVEQEQDIF